MTDLKQRVNDWNEAFKYNSAMVIANKANDLIKDLTAQNAKLVAERDKLVEVLKIFKYARVGVESEPNKEITDILKELGINN